MIFELDATWLRGLSFTQSAVIRSNPRFANQTALRIEIEDRQSNRQIGIDVWTRIEELAEKKMNNLMKLQSVRLRDPEADV